MIILLMPVIAMAICAILSHKIQNVDNNEIICIIFWINFFIFAIAGLICFSMRVADYDKFEVDMARADIVRYIEQYNDDANTDENIYNTIYNKVYNFNHEVYKHQKTRSNPLTSWFYSKWWMEIEPIDWTP